jgi:mRNA-degrading endonuclease RelE of RelBE toxin-antitoxin system
MTYEVVLSPAAQRDLDALPSNLLASLRSTHLPRIGAKRIVLVIAVGTHDQAYRRAERRE